MTEGGDAESITMEYDARAKKLKKCCKQDKQKWFDHKTT